MTRRLPRFRARAQASMAALAFLTLTSACGGSRGRDTIPALPGEGSANTARPGPAQAEPAPSDPWAGRTDLITAPEANAARPVELPPVQRFTLANGLQVMVIERKDLPVVDLQLTIKAGRAEETRERTGLARFVAGMLTKGTRTRNARVLAETIDQVGGTLGADASFEITAISCQVLAKDLGTCLTLVPDVAINSIFPAEEMDRSRKELHAEVRQRKDDAGQIAGVHFQNLLWGESHVRGWPMSEKTIEAITRQDLQAWHKKWFLPNNAILTVAGDVSAKTLRPKLEQAFRTWKRAPAPARAKRTEPTLQGVRVRLIDKPGQTQTHIRLGHLGIAHRDPDFFDMLVFNYTLGGGGFSSRLMKVVRSEAGKTYGASSQFDRNLERGAFVVSTFTRNAEALPTVELLLRELGRMQQEGPTDDEVRDAITYLAGSYATAFESAADFASALLTAELHGLGSDYVSQYPIKVAAVTPESARKAAQARLSTQSFVLVLVGDAKELEPQLARAKVPYEKIGHLEPVASYERKPAAEPETVSPAARAAGKALLNKALAAKGGAAKLKQVKNMIMNGTGKIRSGGQEIPATLTRHYLAPDKLRLDIDIQIPGGTAKVVTVLNGDKAWNRQPPPGGLLELPAEAVAELRKQLWRDQEFILVRAQEAGVDVISLGTLTLDGNEYEGLRIQRGDDQTTLYLDKKTSLIRAMKYVEQGTDTIERYDGYKAVGGIQVAHSRRTENAEASLEVTVTAVKFNDKVAPELFNQP